MKISLLLAGLLFTAAAHAQTIPFDPTAPVRGGSQSQTTIPPVNPALNQSTIQGPPDVQRTATNRDAQPSRQLSETDTAPRGTPAAVPDAREQPIIRNGQPRQFTEVVPGQARRRHAVPQ